MTTDEANGVCAEFMGWKFSTDGSGDYFYLERRWESDIYSESLDALVPVWEKLEPRSELIFDRFYDDEGDYWHVYFKDQKISITYTSLQEAACIATAKAIQELKENKNDTN